MAPPDNGATRSYRIFDTAMAAPAIERPEPIIKSQSSTGPLNMKSEVDRLSTFSDWPVSFMSKKLMASAGFYYLNKADVVRCAFCGVEVGRWVEGDNPVEEHKRWSPSCPLVRKSATNNAETNALSAPTGNANTIYDECGLYGVEIRPNSGPENGKRCETHLLEQLGINKTLGPAHRAYVSMNARMKSFESWPILKPLPEELAEAGFFYTGKGDQTLCFNCGCGLRDWQPSDDPWIEHSKWSPRCTFLLLNKGKDFIQNTLLKEQPFLQPEDIKNLTVNEGKQTEKTSVNSHSKISHKTAATSLEPSNDSRLCKICLQEELGVVFLPCGHLVACVKCAPAVNNCPICRKPLTATVRAFLS